MKDENESDQEKYKNQESSCEDEPVEDTNEMKAIKRAPGRSKILRTGKRGRSKRLFHEVANSTHTEDSDEPRSMEDIFNREDKEL